MATKKTKTYSVLVTEHFVNRFYIEASSKKQAKEIAEERAVDNDWAYSEQVESHRGVEIEE